MVGRHHNMAAERLAYFKNNVSSEEDNDFDPSIHYYNTYGGSFSSAVGGGNSLGNSGNDDYSVARSQPPTMLPQSSGDFIEGLNGGGNGITGGSSVHVGGHIVGGGQGMHSGHVMGGMLTEVYSNESTPFGAEDFPALGGAPGSGRGSLGGSFGGLGQDSAGAGVQQSQNTDFASIMSEDAFPALPGSSGAQSSGTGSAGSGNGTADGTVGRGTGVNVVLDSFQQNSGGNSGTLVDAQKTNGSSSSALEIGNPMELREPLQRQYGLLGLLSVIQMVDPDRNVLALGSDLTTLGLNLNSSKSLYSSFSSPWVEGPSTAEPQFNIPSCYYMPTPPPLKHAHLQKFQLETLFHIFYAMPKDILQAYAAQELYHRDWRYHAELKLWFRRATPQDLPHVHADRAQNQFVFFDINSWENRLFSGIAQVRISASMLFSEQFINSLFCSPHVSLGRLRGADERGRHSCAAAATSPVIEALRIVFRGVGNEVDVGDIPSNQAIRRATSWRLRLQPRPDPARAVSRSAELTSRHLGGSS